MSSKSKTREENPSDQPNKQSVIPDEEDESKQRSVSEGKNPPPRKNLLDTFNHRNIDGINYLCLLKTDDITKVIPLIRDLNLRDDDVIMAGFPKSGNHWVFEILNMVQQQDAKFAETLMVHHFLEVQGEDVQKILDGMPSPRVLGTHFRAHRLPKQILQKKLRIIYPLRNPKDVTVSMYSMVSASSMDGFTYKASFNDFFDQFIEGEFLWGHWVDHVLAMEKFMTDHPDHPVFILSYERMKTSPMEVLEELCDFLGKPDSIAKEIAHATEMSNMKKVLMSGKMGELLKDKFQPDGLFRKGIIGDWRNRLTAEQSEAWDKLIKEKMSNSQLARLVKQYM